jgi:two-component system CheB/CheR fusion protein
VRNMLTIVGAIANQTLARSTSPAEFTQAFLGRIHSMGKSYALVSRENWGEVSFSDVLTTELASHIQDGKERISLSGPEVAFAPSQSLMLGLVFHELATNAVKYGALSKPNGRVTVTWTIEKGRLNIEWLERGGPKLGKVGRKGFGTELIERELKSVPSAKVRINFPPEGAEIQLSLPYPLSKA